MALLSQQLISNRLRCDALLVEAERAAALGDWASAYGLLARFSDSLRRRMQIEESLLYPAVESASRGSCEPLEAIRAEHTDLVSMLDGLALAATREDAETFLTRAEELLVHMERDVAFKEQALYAFAERALGNQADALAERMREFL